MAQTKRESVAGQFGTLLRNARLAAGLSQEALAFEAGIDRTCVSMLERGVRVPTVATLLLLAPPLRQPAWRLMRQLEEACA